MTNNLSGPRDETSGNNEVLNLGNEDQFIKQIQQIEDKFQKEKDSFQKELFHRFKNNLQVITSLLNIQSSYVKDEDSRRMFINSTERVKTIAMIYEKPYQTENLTGIYFDKYLKDLVNYIINNYETNTLNISHEIFTVDVNLNVKIALSCGLIINELISNSLQHAFTGVKAGNIKINLENHAGEYILSVEDDGIGLPKDFNIETNDSLGFLLVRSLIEQINGSLEVIGINGTKFVIKFPGLQDN
jgi:two-component sensor histidine kinase